MTKVNSNVDLKVLVPELVYQDNRRVNFTSMFQRSTFLHADLDKQECLAKRTGTLLLPEVVGHF